MMQSLRLYAVYSFKGLHYINMTTIEISNLRKAGKIEEAYNECITLLSLYPTDRYVILTMAWCLKSIAEKSAKEKNVSRFIETLRELANLNLESIGEISMANRFSWDIKILFESLINEPDQLIATANQIFSILPNLTFARPHKYYSILADAFLKVKGNQDKPWSKFIEFMEWFGFENLRPEDFKSIPLKAQGRSLSSIAERIHNRFHKVLISRIESGYIDKAKIESFIERLSELQQHHPEYQFTLYHKAQLLLILNRKEEAQKAIIPFVRNKQNEYWVWEVLSETSISPELKLSCLCRALLCKTDPKYIGKLHIKMANLMHSLGYDDNARTEMRAMSKIYKENGRTIPLAAIEMVRQPWYQAAKAPESNMNFYKNHLSDSEELIFMGLPEFPILITRYNPERRVCNFITIDKKRGFFSTKKLRGKFTENNVYNIRIENKITENNITKVLTCNLIKDITPFINIFFKKIEGQLKIHSSNDFGFVNDIFIDQTLFPKSAYDGMNVKGTAVLSFNKKKESWGWRAIKLI